MTQKMNLNMISHLLTHKIWTAIRKPNSFDSTKSISLNETKIITTYHVPLSNMEQGGNGRTSGLSREAVGVRTRGVLDEFVHIRPPKEVRV
jgi:hypothetical protein